MPRTCLIINENAGTSEQAALLRQAVGQREDIVCRSNSQAGEGIRMAQEAVHEGFARIGAAGGDGTVHEVVNGIMRARGALGEEQGGHASAGNASAGSNAPAAGHAPGEIAFGIVPLGTGNDLAATLALPEDPRDAVAVLVRQKPRAFDLFQMSGRIEGETRTIYGINAAAGGFSGKVDEAMTKEMKKTWGPLAYLVGTARAVPELHGYDVQIAFDDEAPQALEGALNIVVANGRTVGGGKRVAPGANPCDGFLDVVVVKGNSMIDFAQVGARLMAGTWLRSPHVTHRHARKVRVESTPGMWFNVDGELKTKEPLSFEVLPGALPVVAGPNFEAEVRGPVAGRP